MALSQESLMQRGDVVWYDPDPALGSEQAGHRPAVVISRHALNRSSPVVILIPVTTYRRQRLYPSDVLIRAPEGGLMQDSVAMALHIRGVDRRRIGSTLGRLNASRIREVELAVLQVL